MMIINWFIYFFLEKCEFPDKSELTVFSMTVEMATSGVVEPNAVLRYSFTFNVAILQLNMYSGVFSDNRSGITEYFSWAVSDAVTSAISCAFWLWKRKTEKREVTGIKSVSIK